MIFVGLTDTVQALLDAGTDVNAIAHGRTALMWAKHYSHTKIIELLKQAGAKK